LRHGSLFSGIGGFDLAASWLGWENVFHCEINEFCLQVLKHYWPNAITYKDIITTDFTVWRDRIDILTGGFPCQPFSLAGKRRGTEDDRNLWPEMFRAIRECKPRWIVAENVVGIVTWQEGLVFDQVYVDLESEGYTVQSFIIPACAVNAPHRRERVWFIAYASSVRMEGNRPTWKYFTQPPFETEILRCDNARDYAEKWTSQSAICSKHDGLPCAVDGITFSKWRNESIKGLGNAVVPQLVYELFKTIEEVDHG
jgi:DNA (cytosine-5)-methyltransferase 1